MTPSQALALYAVLVTYADANPADADRFAAYLCDGASWHEWRFCGSLGMGGKLYHSGGALRVGCYSEDETAKRRAVIKRTQAEIDALVGEWSRGDAARMRGASHRRKPPTASDRPPVGAGSAEEPGLILDSYPGEE